MFDHVQSYNPRRSMHLLISSVAVCATLAAAPQFVLADSIANDQAGSNFVQAELPEGTTSASNNEKSTTVAPSQDQESYVEGSLDSKQDTNSANGDAGKFESTDESTDDPLNSKGTDAGDSESSKDISFEDGSQENKPAEKDGSNSSEAVESDQKKDLKDSTEVEPPAIEDGTYVIDSAKDTSKVLDVANGSTASGSNVQLYDSNMTNAQKWNFTYDEKTGYYTIGLAGTNKVLDAQFGGTSNGTNLWIYEKSKTQNDAQLWKVVQKNGAYLFISKLKSDLCIDLQWGNTSNGTNAQLYTANGTLAQLFYLLKVNPEVLPGEIIDDLADGAYSIIAGSENGRYVLSVDGSSQANGANIQLSEKSDSSNQRFYFKSDGNGFYTIMAGNSGKYLDAAAGNLVPGTNVRQWGASGNNQKWALYRNSDGSFSFINKASGLALDISGASFAAGSNVQTYTKNGSKAQRFWLKAFKNYVAGDAAIIEDGVYVIESSVNYSQVFDVANGSTSNGANVQIYQSNMTGAQKWKIAKKGNTGYYTISLNGTNKVLDVSGATLVDGGNVQIYGANGTDAQLWKFIKKGDSFSIVSKLRPDLVLDILGAGGSNGSNIQTYYANGTKAQLFKLLSTNPDVEGGVIGKDGSYVLVAGSSNGKQTIDIASASKANGGNAQLYGKNGTLAQRFYLKGDGKGFYTITSINSGKVLDVASGNLVAGTNVQQWAGYGGACQLWSLRANSDGSYSLISKANGLALDVNGASFTNGTNLQTYFVNGSAAQKFWLVPMAMIDEGIYSISVSGSDKVFDIKNGSNVNGGVLQTWSSNGSLAQRFNVEYDKGTGVYRFRTAASGGWLTVMDDGSIQQLGSSKTEKTDNNSWKAIWNGAFYSFMNVGTGKVMSLAGSANANGTSLKVSSANGSSSQHFFFDVTKLIADGLYEFHSNGKKGSNLDVVSGSKASGANIQVYGDNNTAAQKFYLISSGNGYIIKNFASRKVLDVVNGSKADGANVQIYDQNGTMAQIWLAQIADGGGIVFVNAGSGKALTVEGNNNVDQRTANLSNKNQSWSLEETFGSGWVWQSNSWYFVYEDGSQHAFSGLVKSAYETIKNWTSETSYLICIDNNNLRTIVFQGSAGSWVPIKEWLCSVGKAASNAEEAAEGYGATVRGVYKIVNKGYVMGNDPDYFYWSEFWQPYPGGEGQRFHSRPYYRNSSGTPGALFDGGNFGKAQTHGCVRLDLENVKFIYDYCPLGTKVYSY